MSAILDQQSCCYACRHRNRSTDLFHGWVRFVLNDGYGYNKNVSYNYGKCRRTIERKVYSQDLDTPIKNLQYEIDWH